MSMMSSLIERLRQLVVGSNTWDYCVLWKLSEDQRFLEFVECCCGGSDMQSGSGSDGEELIKMFPCRDVILQHPTSTSCEALAQLPSSHPLDGINMEILISNHPKWLNFSNVSDLDIMNQVIVGTKVLIPIPGGLAELFAAKQVNEDQNIIDYVMEQCGTLMEKEAMNTNCNTSFSIDHMHNVMGEHSTNSQQCGSEKGSALKGSTSADHALVSDSDQLDDLDDIHDPKSRRKVVKGQQSKNLVAERKRRKKLNERLYTLRSLVPNISKLDRAAILGDAIKYVQELQKEQNDLQNELERNSDDEANNGHDVNFSSELSNINPAMSFGLDYDNHMASDHSLKNYENSRNDYNEKLGQQMEVQVEVAQLDGNDFFVKVFGEQKRGGFVRLMEALNCLGLEITNVNMTSCISLVSYVFIVKKRDHSEMVQAEYLRDSLLEATRNQTAGLICMAKVSSSSSNGNGNGIGIGMDHQHNQQHQHHHYQHHSRLQDVHADHINPLHNHFHHLN